MNDSSQAPQPVELALDQWKPIFVNGVIPLEFKAYIEQYGREQRIDELKRMKYGEISQRALRIINSRIAELQASQGAAK